MNILEELDRVFDLEIDTLGKVRQCLDGSHIRAAELLFACTGKVIVTGAGKSGLVAQKIASTMVSTGSPAVFLHPGDGLHGDVGIIGEGDVVVAISKSPIISVTASPESTLGRNSDLVLFTPVDEEACPLNLAPTSSTTAALVLGDALAMALMKMRGINPEQFALFHPGGQLGRRLLLTVADIMRAGENNPVIQAEDTVRNMLSQITGKRSGAVSVVDGQGQLLGLITDYDIRKVLEQGLDVFSVRLTDIMNKGVTHIYSDEMAVAALNLMENRDKPFLLLPVLDRETGKVVGMIHIHDLVARGL